MIINKWFPTNEYAFASSLFSSTKIIGVFGFAIAGLVFSDPTNDTAKNLNMVILKSNYVMTFIFLLFQFTFRESPALPPTKVATETPPKRDFIISFKELGNNRNFQIVCACYSLIVGPFFAFISLMSLIMSPFGITVPQLAIYGVLTALFGVISSIIFAKLLDRTRLYKISLIALSIFPVFVMIALTKSL